MTRPEIEPCPRILGSSGLEVLFSGLSRNAANTSDFMAFSGMIDE
jgi:hypothetical protein